MVRATVAFAILCFTCVNAAPAPRVFEITWLRNSSIDFDLLKKAKGVLNGARHGHLDLPDKTVTRIPEITVLENVHSGAGVILGAHVDVDKILSIPWRVFNVKLMGATPPVLEIAWLRNSSIDFDLLKKAKIVLDDARHGHLDLPDKTVDKISKITVLENVHSGAGVILGAHVDVDKILSLGKSIKDKLLPVLEENVKEFITALIPY